MLSSANILLVSSIVVMAVALGGGIYEGIIVNPQWSLEPPRSFRIIQPTSGMPLQRFWMPVHAVLTLAMPAALVASWNVPERRLWIEAAIASYVVMRAWSFAYFIPEMIRFQNVDASSASTPALTQRVRRWNRLTWWRMPLDLLSVFAFVVSLTLSQEPSVSSETKHLSVSIHVPPHAVYEFVSDPENLPTWAAGLSQSKVERVGEDWFVDSPMGRVKVKFCAKNELGVLDHDVTLPDGSTTHNPLRVVPREQGSEVIFTLLRGTKTSAEEFERDAQRVAEDLQTLKALLERSQ